MPIYEYECQKCGRRIEVLQSISAEPIKHCQECGAEALKRLISASSFVLKGSGFYVTDYPSKERTEALKTESETGKEKKADKKLESVVKKEQ